MQAPRYTLYIDFADGRGAGRDYEDRDDALNAWDQVCARPDVAHAWVRLYAGEGEPRTVAEWFCETAGA